ncbi:MAG: OB-fold domain-containing protein [Myxococcota bacterium]|nr:OB-fold domain-containing protein [Myxococcota bacterium]
MGEPAGLTQPYRLEYVYKRGLGPVLNAFFNGLKRAQLLGVRGGENEIFCPPSEYHPESAESLTEMVELTGAGEIVHAFWIAQPLAHHPSKTPFAFALIRLDQCSSHFLHIVDTGGDESLACAGLRVRPRWADERIGSIRDLESFVPESVDQSCVVMPEGDELLERLNIPVSLEYQVRAGRVQSRFLHQLSERKIIGRRSPASQKVLLPPRGACPQSGELCAAEVEVSDSGTVVAFTVVRIDFPGQQLKPPYACASVLLDGADQPILHLLKGLPGSLRIGMRVVAVWRDEALASMQAIDYFCALDEADAAADTYAEHL